MEYEVYHMKTFIADNTNSIRFLSNLLGILLSDLNRYLMLYESILSELDHLLDALDNLSNNQLSHSVISPKEMNDLIMHVNEVLKAQYPNYELVVSKVHDYYNLPFSTFACQGNILMIHISFYIKQINLETLYMYEIKSIPVPYHMNEDLIDETESKYTYTKIKPSTEILALGSNSHIGSLGNYMHYWKSTTKYLVYRLARCYFTCSFFACFIFLHYLLVWEMESIFLNHNLN